MSRFERKDFGYYSGCVGRYLPGLFDDEKTFKPYKEEKNKLVWNVIVEDNGEIYPQNIFEYNWVFLRDGLLYAKKHYNNDYIKFADHINRWLRHEYWARTEYEVLVSQWPNRSLYQKDLDELQKDLNEEAKRLKKEGYDFEARTDWVDPSTVKIDVYTQLMMNWDQFIQYIWNNKKLISAKKLGLDK